MRVLVCGGRDFDDWGKMLDTFYHFYTENMKKDLTIITGDAKGADWLARAWAKFTKASYEGYPADWKKHGKAAGPIRNKQMLDEGKPELVIAFPGGSGTADMVRQAKARGIKVLEV